MVGFEPTRPYEHRILSAAWLPDYTTSALGLLAPSYNLDLYTIASEVVAFSKVSAAASSIRLGMLSSGISSVKSILTFMCPQRDSNPHCTDFKSALSAIGVRGRSYYDLNSSSIFLSALVILRVLLISITIATTTKIIAMLLINQSHLSM